MSQPGRGHTADLLLAVTELCASKSPAELAHAAAALARHWLPSESVHLVLSGPEGEASASHGGSVEALGVWALELCRGGSKLRLTEHNGHVAALIVGGRDDVRGVLAIAPSQPFGDEERRTIAALAHFVGACAVRQEEERRSSRMLEDAKRSLGKGLHDVRTPLNSVRLGLHLLEPALATGDATIVQRIHRAVDRMTALVTEMADVLHAPPAADRRS